MRGKCEIYITIDNYESKKSCFKIQFNSHSCDENIIVVPCFSKNYTGLKLLNNWHTTRHNTFLHRTLYINGDSAPKGHPLRSYYEQETNSLKDITDYEIIDCFQLSPVILDRYITRDYRKKPVDNRYEIILTAYQNQYYQVYVFINPLGKRNLYNDLSSYGINYFIFKGDFYELVVAIDSIYGFNSNSICNCLGIYIKNHKNLGIGNFVSLR